MRRVRSARPARRPVRRLSRRPVTQRVGRGYLTVIPFDFAKENRRARRNNGQQHALSPDQQEALEKILAALNAPTEGRKVLVLAGPAGTGKTTLMRALLAMLSGGGSKVALLAPTGKAASRLRESTGMQTSTVHSFIYSGASELGICPNCGEVSRELALSKREMKEAGMKGLTCPACQTFFPIGTRIKSALAFKDQQGKGSDEAQKVGLAIIDEASMVSQALQEQMFQRKPGLHVLYVGDREQLPPFGDTEADRAWGPNFDAPTALLTQIHRQAADNPIIAWATRLREDKNTENPFEVGKEDPNNKIQFFIRPAIQQIAEWYAHQVREGRSAVVLCGSNDMTAKVNAAVRGTLPYAGTNRSLATESEATGLPYVAGDLLMCIFNKRDAGLMNGEIFSVVGSAEIGPTLSAEGFSYVTIRNAAQEQTFMVYNKMAPLSARDAGEEKKEVESYTKRWKQLVEALEYQYGSKDEALAFLGEMDPEDLFKSYRVINPARVLYAVYGYAITVQKSQGSQWQSVGVVWDSRSDRAWTGDEYVNTRRWLYTAITRTSDRVAVFDLSGRYTHQLRGDRLDRMGVSLPQATTKKDMEAFMAPFQPRWEKGDEYTEIELARLLDRPSVPGLLFSRACLETLLQNPWVFSQQTNDGAYARSLAERWRDVPAIVPGQPVDTAAFEPLVGKALHHDTVRFLTKFRKRLASMAAKFSSRRREGLISKVNPRRRRRVR
jgi:hypothetical protein